MTAETPADLFGMRAAGKLVREVFERMKAAALPGITTAELDDIAQSMFAAATAQSAPQLFYQFPGATCISVNEHAAHGIPGEQILRDSDMVNIDVSAEFGGYVADMGESFVIGDAKPAQKRICDAVREAVAAAIEEVRPGRSLNVIGRAVQAVADSYGYQIVRNLGSHGVGRSIHEEPSFVPLDNPREKRRLGEGMVFTIEPFFTTGKPWVEQLDDGWTLVVPGGELVAQFEQTLIVTRQGAEVVTA